MWWPVLAYFYLNTNLVNFVTAQQQCRVIEESCVVNDPNLNHNGENCCSDYTPKNVNNGDGKTCVCTPGTIGLITSIGIACTAPSTIIKSTTTCIPLAAMPPKEETMEFPISRVGAVAVGVALLAALAPPPLPMFPPTVLPQPTAIQPGTSNIAQSAASPAGGGVLPSSAITVSNSYQ